MTGTGKKMIPMIRKRSFCAFDLNGNLHRRMSPGKYHKNARAIIRRSWDLLGLSLSEVRCFHSDLDDPTVSPQMKGFDLSVGQTVLA